MENCDPFFDNPQAMQDEVDMDPDDAMQLAREAQEWAREQN